MAQGFFVKNGFLIETIEIDGQVFTPNQGQSTPVVTLNSVRDILTTILANPGSGTPQEIAEAQLTALKAIWSATLTDIAQAGAQGEIVAQSNLISQDVPDSDNSALVRSIHNTSYQNILPPRFNEAWNKLSLDENSLDNEKNRNIIKSIEGSFTDIKIHPVTPTRDATATKKAAYAAYNEWILRGQGDNATKTARQGYLRNG